jgi:hypothetical protein
MFKISIQQLVFVWLHKGFVYTLSFYVKDQTMPTEATKGIDTQIQYLYKKKKDIYLYVTDGT